MLILLHLDLSIRTQNGGLGPLEGGRHFSLDLFTTSEATTPQTTAK